MDMVTIGCKEIIEYALEKPGISYYDIVKIAYDSSNEAWIKALNSPSSRLMISEIFKVNRREAKVPYINSYKDSYLAALRAKSDYYKRQDELSIERLEKSVQ